MYFFKMIYNNNKIFVTNNLSMCLFFKFHLHTLTKLTTSTTFPIKFLDKCILGLPKDHPKANSNDALLVSFRKYNYGAPLDACPYLTYIKCDWSIHHSVQI